MGHMLGARARTRRRRSILSAFREQRVLIEKAPFIHSVESFRLMMVRDEIPEIVEIMRVHGEALPIVIGLLKDDYISVGATAADVLRSAILAGLDVSGAEEGLLESLKDKYAKRNAAAALSSLYMRRGDVASLDRLLMHEDGAVRDSACEASLSRCLGEGVMA